jgi:DUF438 domain-containing protein
VDGQTRPLSREERVALLGHIISELHDGGDLATARERFIAAVGDVDPSEIAAMEETLIKNGLPVSEVQRLCDVHVGAFKPSLDNQAAPAAAPGHPVHTYLADNQALAQLASRLVDLSRDPAAMPVLASVLAGYAGLDNHYQRKEHQLFPLLERHGVTGPTQVMWGVHDQIRGQWKALAALVEKGHSPSVTDQAAALSRGIVEMIYKEEKILFPMALQALTPAEWIEEKRGEDELGYALAKPAAEWPGPLAESGRNALPVLVGNASPPANTNLLPLNTGALSLEMINLLYRHLPLDLSFVDEHDVVRFYSEGRDRVFPRTESAIGRTVQNCHPPKSVHMVNQILEAFRAGKKDVAEFWLPMGPRFIHIRYFAVRDDRAVYRGCLEVVQDVSGIRGLDGQRRLLDWEN